MDPLKLALCNNSLHTNGSKGTQDLEEELWVNIIINYNE